MVYFQEFTITRLLIYNEKQIEIYDNSNKKFLYYRSTKSFSFSMYFYLSINYIKK